MQRDYVPQVRNLAKSFAGVPALQNVRLDLERGQVHALIGQLAREGKAILLASSELPELLALSDRILVMRQGALAAELCPRETSQAEILKLAMPV
jgi:ABC-type sugar transport system ATPase subunit